MEACVLSIVIGSAAWVEASGNEVFSICAETPNIHTFETLRKDRIPVAAFIWDNFRLEPNGVRKWELLTNALAEIELDPKHPAVAEMNLLTRLRNRCIHAKPSHWPARDKGDIDLEKALKDKFVLNSFEGRGVFFPDSVLSRGCAAWAAETAEKFLKHVLSVLNLPPHFGV